MQHIHRADIVPFEHKQLLPSCRHVNWSAFFPSLPLVVATLRTVSTFRHGKLTKKCCVSRRSIMWSVNIQPWLYSFERIISKFHHMKVVPPGGLASLIKRCDRNLIGVVQAECSKGREDIQRGGTE